MVGYVSVGYARSPVVIFYFSTTTASNASNAKYVPIPAHH